MILQVLFFNNNHKCHHGYQNMYLLSVLFSTSKDKYFLMEAFANIACNTKFDTRFVVMCLHTYDGKQSVMPIFYNRSLRCNCFLAVSHIAIDKYICQKNTGKNICEKYKAGNAKISKKV